MNKTGDAFMDMKIDRNHIETLYETKFLRCYDLQYAEGKHYYVASRRGKEDLVAGKADDEFRSMLPDAVTIAVVLHLPGNDTRLLMSYEYRYPVGQFLLSPVAGLLDPDDRASDNPLVNAAVREIREETGLTVKESDRVYVLNPCAFSTPGMTDESNAFLCAEITLENLDELNQNGAEGSELFDGFELLDREHAQDIFRTGRDDHGNFYSLAAWMVLSIFLSLF
jgi:ADP-ribose pyrophosphatase